MAYPPAHSLYRHLAQHATPQAPSLLAGSPPPNNHTVPYETRAHQQVDAITALMESTRGTDPGHLDGTQLTTLLQTLLTSRTVHARALSAFLGAYGSLRDVQYVMLRGIATLCSTRREDRTSSNAAAPRNAGPDVLPDDDVARNVYDTLLCIYHEAMEQQQHDNGANVDDDGVSADHAPPVFKVGIWVCLVVTALHQ